MTEDQWWAKRKPRSGLGVQARLVTVNKVYLYILLAIAKSEHDTGHGLGRKEIGERFFADMTSHYGQQHSSMAVLSTLSGWGIISVIRSRGGNEYRLANAGKRLLKDIPNGEN